MAAGRTATAGLRCQRSVHAELHAERVDRVGQVAHPAREFALHCHLLLRRCVALHRRPAIVELRAQSGGECSGAPHTMRPYGSLGGAQAAYVDVFEAGVLEPQPDHVLRGGGDEGLVWEAVVSTAHVARVEAHSRRVEALRGIGHAQSDGGGK